MSEFVIVRFEESRDVLMDDVAVGKTNVVLTVERGVHTFMLAGALTYVPSSVAKAIQGTTPATPIEIWFVSGLSSRSTELPGNRDTPDYD